MTRLRRMRCSTQFDYFGRHSHLTRMYSDALGPTGEAASSPKTPGAAQMTNPGGAT